MDEEEGLLSKQGRLLDDEGLGQHLGQHGPYCCRFSESSKWSACARLRYPASSCFSTAYIAILHILCLSLGTYLLFSCARARAQSDYALLDFDRRYSNWIPISYEIQHEDLFASHTSEYTGLPNETNTRAWDDLITPTFFSASLQDLHKTDESVNDSVRLARGGYIAGLGVYHNIHCLRRLRIFLHSDYYYGNLSEANMEYLRGHLGHCIESLRRSILCNADTTLYTFTWEDAEMVRPGIYRPKPKSNQERKCVRWEAVEEWVKARHVPLNPVLLKPSGEEEKILM